MSTASVPVSAASTPLFPLASEREPTLTVLSFGGGQDSTAILARLIHEPEYRARWAPGDLAIVMSDTGDEWRETYDHVALAKTLAESDGVPFAFLEAGDAHHAETWPSLTGFYDRTSTVGSKAYPKTCSVRLKVDPIHAWLAAYVRDTYGCTGERYARSRSKAPIVEFADRYGPIRMLIGIAAGEEKRLGGEPPSAWQRFAITYAYPLVEDGMDRAACQRVIREHGIPVPVPSNCHRCPFVDERELLYLAHARPDVLDDWRRQERAKLDAWEGRATRNLGVWGKELRAPDTGEKRPMTLDDALALAREKHGHLSVEELATHRFSHGHCVASAW